MYKSMPLDARDAVAEAFIVGRFRYAARLLFIWRESMTTCDEHAILDDIESYTGYPADWQWGRYNQSVTLRYKGEVFSYRRQDVTEETWHQEPD